MNQCAYHGQPQNRVLDRLKRSQCFILAPTEHTRTRACTHTHTHMHKCITCPHVLASIHAACPHVLHPCSMSSCPPSMQHVLMSFIHAACPHGLHPCSMSSCPPSMQHVMTLNAILDDFCRSTRLVIRSMDQIENL